MRGRPVTGLALGASLALAACAQILGADSPTAKRDAGVTCREGLSSCVGSCVDLTKDPANCGACSSRCEGGPGETAHCVTDPAATPATTCVRCAEGLVRCGRACVDALRDPLHCGACDNDCGGAACENGACGDLTLGTALAVPDAVRLSGDRAYWIDTAGTGVVASARKRGPPCAATDGTCAGVYIGSNGGVRTPGSVVVREDGVFSLHVGGAVVRWSLDLTTSIEVSRAPSSSAMSLTGSREYLCWVEHPAPPAFQGVHCQALAGPWMNKPVSFLTPTQRTPTIQLEASRLFLGLRDDTEELRAGIYSLDPTAVCAGSTCPVLWRPDRGPPTDPRDVPLNFTVTGGYVYWYTGGQRLYRQALATPCRAGGVCGTLLATGMGDFGAPSPIAADDRHVYWGDGEGLHRAALDVVCECTPSPVTGGCTGGSCETIVTGRRVGSIALDDAFIYYTSLARAGDVAGGDVRKRRKPR